MFDQTSGASSSNNSNSGELIPHGTLARVSVMVTGIKESKRTGGGYANLELVILDGPYAKRRIWTVVMNPADPRNMDDIKRAEGKVDGAKMGLVALTRIFEAAGVFTADPRSYMRFNGASFNTITEALNGLTAAIKIKIAKGKDGYEDKNEVAEFLSPVSSSGTTKYWQQLVRESAGSARQEAFTAPQAPAMAPIFKVEVAKPQQPQQTQPQPSSRPAWIKAAVKPAEDSQDNQNNPF
jgi:hypothetical protein